MRIEHVAENLVRVVQVSPISGNINTMELPIRQGQIEYWQFSGELVQNVFPHLNADEREFLMTGITPEEWSTTFGKE
tara:strand:- start:407 stop:637 length:231 start_codon:yes stop_codon:yes gene_type:complete